MTTPHRCDSPSRRGTRSADVAALLAGRQLAGNTTGAVAVEHRADELLVRVETLPLPPHVAHALEHLLEPALPPSTSSARMKVSNF
jgi:hypothetical protein